MSATPEPVSESLRVPLSDQLDLAPERAAFEAWVAAQPGSPLAGTYIALVMWKAWGAAVAAERDRCAKLCEAGMEAAERESGPEAAGWLHQTAQHMRGLGV